MAYLNDTAVDGDLRVTGKIYGNLEGNNITLNGVSTPVNSVSIYAPTTGGTSGQVLQSNGASVAPTWVSKVASAAAADYATVASDYHYQGTIRTALDARQDKPSSATSGNIATFNSSKSTIDSGKKFLTSTGTWDGTSDALIPTVKAITAQLGTKGYGIHVPMDAGQAIYVTMQVSTARTGCSSMLIVLSGNNGNYCCLQLSWFKIEGQYLTAVNGRVIASSSNVGYATVPVVKWHSGENNNNLCGIFIILDNPSFATSALLFPCTEDNDALSIGTMQADSAQGSGPNTVALTYNLYGGWDSTPTQNSTNAVTSHGIWEALNVTAKTYLVATVYPGSARVEIYNEASGALLALEDSFTVNAQVMHNILVYGQSLAVTDYHFVFQADSSIATQHLYQQSKHNNPKKSFREGTRNIVTVQEVGSTNLNITLHMGGRSSSSGWYDKWKLVNNGTIYTAGSSEPVEGDEKTWSLGTVSSWNSWEIVCPIPQKTSTYDIPELEIAKID